MVRVHEQMSLYLGKMLAYRTASLDFDTAMQFSEAAIPLVDQSRDFREVRAAFVEKREADFSLGRSRF